MFFGWCGLKQADDLVLGTDPKDIALVFLVHHIHVFRPPHDALTILYVLQHEWSKVHRNGDVASRAITERNELLQNKNDWV